MDKMIRKTTLVCVLTGVLTAGISFRQPSLATLNAVKNGSFETLDASLADEPADWKKDGGNATMPLIRQFLEPGIIHSE